MFSIDLNCLLMLESESELNTSERFAAENAETPDMGSAIDYLIPIARMIDDYSVIYHKIIYYVNDIFFCR